MPEYCITTRELWHSYLYLEADDIDDAVALVESGGGELQDSEWVETIGFTSVRDKSTNEVTSLVSTPMEEGDPNSIFSKSKKQEEVDKAIEVLDNKIVNYEIIAKAVSVLKGIKNI